LNNMKMRTASHNTIQWQLLTQHRESARREQLKTLSYLLIVSLCSRPKKKRHGRRSRRPRRKLTTSKTLELEIMRLRCKKRIEIRKLSMRGLLRLKKIKKLDMTLRVPSSKTKQ